MKTFFIYLALTGVALSQVAPLRNVIRTYRMDDKNVYIIKVPQPAQGVVTVSFPSKITSLDGDAIAAQPNPQAKFLIAYHPGEYFFSLKSVYPGVTTNLNVIYNHKTYVLKLVASDKPDFAIQLISDQGPPTSAHASITPSILLSLLDKAKAYPLLKDQLPDVLSQVEHVQPHRTMYYPDFTVNIDDVYRFEEEDTIVFALTINNNTNHVVYYKPQGFAVRVGDKVYYQSISDASGLLPPGNPMSDAKGYTILNKDGSMQIQPTPSQAYFAITGTADGHRNNLSPDNAWNIIVNQIQDVITQGAPALTPVDNKLME